MGAPTIPSQVRQRTFNWSLLAIAIAVALLVFIPLLWVFRFSLEQTFSAFIPMIPAVDQLTFANYTAVLTATRFPRWVLNSIVFAGGVTLLNVVLAPLAGYALARKRIRFADTVFWVILALWIVPFEVVVLPLYLMLAEAGMLNTYMGLILPLGVEPLSVFIMRQYMLTLPKDFEEAALVDGASRLQAFFRVVLPMTTPVVMAVAIVTFVLTWGYLLFPLVLTTDSSMATLTVGIAGFAYGTVVNWGMMMTATLLGAVPTVVLFLFMSRRFLESMTMAGGVEG